MSKFDSVFGDLKDQPIKVIINKGKLISTQYLVDIVGECYGKINSNSDGTYTVLFDGEDNFDRYNSFLGIIDCFNCQVKGNDF